MWMIIITMILAILNSLFLGFISLMAITDSFGIHKENEKLRETLKMVGDYFCEGDVNNVEK